MGYTTYFSGEFKLDKPLAPEHKAYLEKFSQTRRVKRDAAKAALLPDPVREAAGLPIGSEGAYFVGGTGCAGQDRDDSILDYNRAPKDQPGLWCQWQPDEDGEYIEQDGGEKFYNYTEWIEYLIEHFLAPWGYTVNGEVDWDGEESGDDGTITVENNVVTSESRYDLDQKAIQTEAALDEVLKKIPEKLPLLMGINEVLDKKLKKIFEAAGKNPINTALIVVFSVTLIKFITLTVS